MGRDLRDKILQEIKVSSPNKLLDFLLEKNVRKSRNAIKSLLAHKQITVNGKYNTQFDFLLKSGDMVSIMKYDQSRKEKKLNGLKIVYEDEYIIVIDKDSGILSVATEREKIKTVYLTMTEYVKKQKEQSRIFILHRLEREISGLMVLARDLQVQSAFQKNWPVLVKNQIFTGLVDGHFPEKTGEIVSWLTENKNFQVFSNNFDNGGLRSVTNYKVIKSNDLYSLVDFTLVTRRKNQIRAQMQMVEHPIIGDKKYGSKMNPVKRIALHASKLVIKHPVTSEIMEFESPLPKSIQTMANPVQDKGLTK